MAHGLQVFDASSNVMMESDMKLMRVVLTVSHPAIIGGTSWTYSSALITANCTPLLFAPLAYAICYNGYVTVYHIAPNSGYPTQAAGQFTIVKGIA